MLLSRRQISVIAMGQRYQKSSATRRHPPTILQPNLTEYLAGHRTNSHITNPQNLQWNSGPLRLPLQTSDTPRIDPRQIRLTRQTLRLRQRFRSPRQLLSSRYPPAHRQFTHPPRNLQLTTVFQPTQHPVYLVRHILSDQTHLLIRRGCGARSSEVDVVHITTGPVRQHRHKRNRLRTGPVPTTEGLTKHPEIIGRDVTIPDATHIMQRIRRIHRNRSAPRLAHTQN